MIKMELLILGQNIRSVRKTLKLSQEGLAEMSHLHRTYVCDVERGARNVTYCTLLRIARSLRMTISQLTQNIDANARPRMKAGMASAMSAGRDFSLPPECRRLRGHAPDVSTRQPQAISANAAV